MAPPMMAVLARLRREAAAFVVLAIGVLATAAVYLYVERAVAAQAEARFEALAVYAVDAIRDRIDAYLATLRATRALFARGREPSRAEFAAFVPSLELNRYYPGIQGIGYAKLIPPDDLERHERSVRAEGFPEYRVWPLGPRDVYTSIVYLEPFDWRNERAFGYDMMSEPVRRDAMIRARDTGVAACSGRVELVQEAGEQRQPGFLIYLGVYGEGPRTVPHAERVLGFVYASFRAGDLLGATLGGEQLLPLAIEVFDGDHVGPGGLLYSSPQPAVEGGLKRLTRMDVAGRLWTVRIGAARALVAQFESWLPRAVVVLGLLGTVVLFRITQGEVRSRGAAQRSALRASFLAEAGKVLSSSFDYRASLAQVATRAACDLADWCIVLLVEPEGPVRMVGHRDEGRARAMASDLAGLLLDPEARFGAAAALERGEPFLVEAVDEAALARIARSPAQLEALRAIRLRSVMTVPLRTRGESLGAITFASSDPDRSFDRSDIAMGQDLGRLAVAAIDTARLYRQAQDAVRLRDDFLSIASHELRTPLTSLALQSDSLLTAAVRGQAPEPIRHKTEVIHRNVDRLNRLITNLLDISRIGSGRLELDIEELDLGDIVTEVAGRFEDELARAGCELRVDVERPALGRWDRLRLDQVVTNLVSNAVKYGPGRPITIGVRSRGDRVVLTVRDEGIGIPVDAQERIFERFERAVTDRHYGGFGLGLWIVRRIVEALGGEIRVESEPGQGATFTVELRRDTPAGQERSAPTSI